MDRSLWLLLRLRLKGWARRLAASLGTVRGAMLTLITLGFFALILAGAVFQNHARPETLHDLRAYGPLGLIGVCLLQVITSSSERGLYFTPAEVQFLFTAPLGRRQLLAYKILGNLGVTSFVALLLGVTLRSWSGSIPAGMAGAFLLFSFLQLFAMTLNLAACAVGAHAYDRRRQTVLGAVVVALLAVVIYAAGNPLDEGWSAWSKRVQDSDVGRILLLPVRCFFEALTAERLWPDLVQWSLASVVVLGALVGLIFLFDAQYLEAAATASERLYARMERIRRGGPSVSPSGTGRLAAPPLPHLGGAGPIAWRQFTALLRAWKSWLIYLAIMLPILLYPLLAGAQSDQPLALAVVMPFLFMVLYVGPTLLRYDFRADLDRMDLLKSLPLSPWSLALGQVLLPTTVLTGFSWLILGYLIVKGETGQLGILTAAMVPANFLMVTLENLLFLWYPTRLTSGPGDFRHFGRNMVLGVSRLVLFFVAMLPATVAGTAAYLLSGENLLVAATIAWIIAMAICLATLGLVAMAFRRFDVAKEIG